RCPMTQRRALPPLWLRLRLRVRTHRFHIAANMQIPLRVRDNDTFFAEGLFNGKVQAAVDDDPIVTIVQIDAQFEVKDTIREAPEPDIELRETQHMPLLAGTA